jgi:hypothetical protein
MEGKLSGVFHSRFLKGGQEFSPTRETLAEGIARNRDERCGTRNRR